jgi:TonB-linked SusC/RagA family outer membrane protein
MMDFNFGFTGSENFQPGRQYGFFPSIALGWVPTNYKWVKEKLSWINFFKIRASHGTVGNDKIQGSGRFPYLTMVNAGKTSIWGNAIPTEVVNELVVGADNLVWERAIKTNIGIDSKFFKDKITLTVDIFNDQRNGIFWQRTQVPDYVGLISTPYGNTGKMRSYGSDGTISFSHEITRHTGFTLRGNYTYARSMVQNWEDIYRVYPYLENTGFPNGVMRGFHSLGLFKDEDDVKYSPDQSALGGMRMPGDIKYKDINGDGRINNDDKVPLPYGNQHPLLMYGFGGEFRYKNLSVGVLLKGTGKSEYFKIGTGNDQGYDPFNGGEHGNVLSIVADPRNRWIPMDYALAHGIDPALAENPNAMFPRLSLGYNSNNIQLSDFWKGDARYLRLQEITVNYNIKNMALKKVGISSVNVQLIGTNLYTWDKVKLFDPEQATANGRVYPLPSTFSLQLYINL